VTGHSAHPNLHKSHHIALLWVLDGEGRIGSKSPVFDPLQAPLLSQMGSGAAKIETLSPQGVYHPAVSIPPPPRTMQAPQPTRNPPIVPHLAIWGKNRLKLIFLLFSLTLSQQAP
jgi:hypothetical protein